MTPNCGLKKRPSRRFRRGRTPRLELRVFFVLLLLLAPSGCASFRRGPMAENVVASRELSLSGMEAIQRGQWEQAEMLFRRALQACPTDERTRSRLAETLWRRGASDSAVAQMEQAVQLSGGDPGLLVRLGEMYLALGQLDRAGYQAERAIGRNRQLASAWALRGHVLARQQQLQEALASYHRALSYQPHYPDVQLAVARIYQQQDRPQRALTTLEALADQYLPGGEPQQVLLLHGLALQALGRHAEAVESLLAASQRGRPSADILYHLGEAQMLAGDERNARRSVSAALQLDPQHLASRQLKSELDQRRQQMAVSLRR